MAGLAALSLLLQVLFAAPLAARMMRADPICGVPHEEGGAPAPAIPHDHGACLICHAGALPVALIAVAIVLALPRFGTWRADAAPTPTGRPQARRWRPAPRAPPALA
ncbi:MAG: DUF2946 family protein [Rhodospirillales bacterium]|nr:DUF2946 family protein [Rhodospirillales bacterium]